MGDSITTELRGLEERRSVTFAWRFSSGGGPASCGRFANGDYWIAPAPGKSVVTVTAIEGRGGGAVSADANPQLEAHGLLSRDYGSMEPERNIIPRLPIAYDAPVSLVAAMERDEERHGACGTPLIHGSCAEAYQVVTVLDAVPAGTAPRAATG